jgi:hypothetical protein
MLFCNNPNKKKVTFSNIVLVCLIPDRYIMFENNMIESLWWSMKDYIDFRKNVKKQVTFSNTVLVSLIPDRCMMFENNMIESLWWSMKDYIDFRKNVKNENDYF